MTRRIELFEMDDFFQEKVIEIVQATTLEWTKRVVLDPLQKYDVHISIGNHDCYYKNTNDVNSPDLLLKNYSNIKIYNRAEEVTLDNLKILLLPWINSENYEETKNLIDSTNAKVVMGHLELNGFQATRGHVMENGTDIRMFDKFEKVYSGHFHTRSNDGKIYYLGNPYEMYWNDVNDPRGFHIFDTDTLEHTPINNPYKLFYNIYYDDTNYKLFNTTQYLNKIVKVIVRKKSNSKDFEKFIDKLYSSGVQDLKIIENFAIAENQTFDIDEDENTLSILNRYIDESEIEFDKTIIKDIFQDIYRQACEVE